MDQELEEKARIIEELEADIIQSATLGKELLDRNNELEQQIKEQEDAYADNLDALKQENFCLRNRIENQEKLVSQQHSDLEQMRTAAQEREWEHLELEKLRVVHAKAVSRWELKVSQLIDELDSANAAHESTKDRLQRQEQLLSEWKERETNKSSSSFLEVEVGSLQSTVDRLDRANEELQMKLQDGQAMVARLSSDEEKYKSRIVVVLEEVDCRGEEITSLQTALQATKEKNLELSQEVQMLKMDSVDINKRKGNSLFSEVDDRRIETERRFISLKVKHESLEKAHTVAQHQLRRLKVRTRSATHSPTPAPAAASTIAQGLGPGPACGRFHSTAPPLAKRCSALLSPCVAGEKLEGWRATGRALFWTYDALDSPAVAPRDLSRNGDKINPPVGRVGCSPKATAVLQSQQPSVMLTSAPEENFNTLWYDYGDLYSVLAPGTSQSVPMHRAAEIDERKEVCVCAGVVDSENVSMESVDSACAICNQQDVPIETHISPASPNLRNPLTLSEKSEEQSDNNSSWPSDYVVICTPEKEEETDSQLPRNASCHKRRNTGQRGFGFLQRRRRSSAGKGRQRRSSSSAAGLHSPPGASVRRVSSSDLSFYSCSSPAHQQPPPPSEPAGGRHRMAADGDTPLARRQPQSRDEPANPTAAARSGAVLHLVTRVLKSVFGRFRKRSRVPAEHSRVTAEHS